MKFHLLKIAERKIDRLKVELDETKKTNDKFNKNGASESKEQDVKQFIAKLQNEIKQKVILNEQ